MKPALSPTTITTIDSALDSDSQAPSTATNPCMVSAFPGLTLVLYSEHPSIVNALACIFEPISEVNPNGVTARVTVHLTDIEDIAGILSADSLREIHPFLANGVTTEVFCFENSQETGAIFASSEIVLLALMSGEQSRRIECYVIVKRKHSNAFPAISAVLWPLLKRIWLDSGHLLIHAGALNFGGKGILLLADSGGGKSTTTLALVKGGAKFLCDDIALLSNNDGKAKLQGIRELVKVTRKTIGFFPELARYQDHLDSGSPKVAFPVEELFGEACVSDACNLSSIFILQLTQQGPQIDTVSASEAFPLLLRAQHIYAKQAIDRRAVDILHQIVDTIPVFRLGTGPNPNLIYDAIQSTLADVQ